MIRWPHLLLTPRLALAFVLFGAALLAFIGVLAYSSGRSGLEAATLSALTSVATEKQAMLADWVTTLQTDLSLLATSPGSRDLLTALVHAQPGSAAARSAHDDLVKELQSAVGGANPFLALWVMDPGTGQVIAATDPDMEGTYLEDRPYFINGKSSSYVQNPYYSLSLQRVAMAVSGPFRAADGQILAVLAAYADLPKMNSIISRVAGLGQTEDTFLVNTSNLFVTQPRLLPDPAVLQRGVHTEPVNRCLSRTSGSVFANDYRGIPVLAVYRWLPERQLCLIVKMDQAEALAPAQAFGSALVLIGGLVLTLAVVLAVSLARTLTRPIRALQAGVTRFGQGELTIRLADNAHDELGLLAREFNRMAASIAEKDSQLREYAGQLELKVEERTAALRTSEQRYRSLFEHMLNGFAYCKMEFDHGIPQDFTYLEVNKAFETLTGLQNVTSKKVSDVIPGIRESDPELFNIYARVAATGQPETFETYLASLNMWFSIAVYSPAPENFVAVFDVITERKQAEVALHRYADRLAAINRLDRIISTGLDITQVYDNFVKELLALIPLDRTSIVQLNGSQDQWQIIRQWTRHEPIFWAGDWHPVKGSAIERLVLNRAPFLEKEIGEAGAFTETEGLQREGIRSRLLLPLIIQEQVIGALTAGSHEAAAFSDEDQSILSAIADQLAIAIQNARLYERVQRHAAELEQRVTQRTAELSDLYNNAPCGYHSLDSNGIIDRINDTELVWLGYTREELVGKVRFSDLLTPASVQIFNANVPRLKERGCAKDQEFDVVRKDGSILPILVSATAIVDPEGRFVTSRLTVMDNTERKAQERQLRYHASLQENVSDAVIVTDMDLHIQSWNKAAERIYGWSEQEVLGRNSSDLLRSEFSSPDERQRVVEKIQAGSWYQTEVVQHHKDGSRIDLLGSVTVVKDGNGHPLGIVAVNRDITAHKQAENALRQRSAELEAANKELEAFSYSVSHDLRAPLRAIDGFSRILLEDYATAMSEEAQEYLNLIREGAQQMGNLIDHLLDFSRLGRQPLRKQRVMVADLVQAVLADLQTAQEGRKVDIAIADLPDCQADPTLLRQVFVNLLANAVKFTKTRQPAVIEIGCLERESETVYFVKDNGVGFDMQYVNKLFGVFQRLHRVEDYEGTGVGLATVQRIIHRHGGRIWAEAEVDKGATFYFTLGDEKLNGNG